jgi:hypothetical protein
MLALFSGAQQLLVLAKQGRQAIAACGMIRSPVETGETNQMPCRKNRLYTIKCKFNLLRNISAF